MTTLRSFQNEIDEIHTREVLKQRTQALLDKEKDGKPAKGKTKEEVSEALDTTFHVSENLNLQELEERIIVSAVSRMGSSVDQRLRLGRRYCSLRTQPIMKSREIN
jgi:hypothetical protein